MEYFINRRCVLSLLTGKPYTGIVRKLAHHPDAFGLEIVCGAEESQRSPHRIPEGMIKVVQFLPLSVKDIAEVG